MKIRLSSEQIERFETDLKHFKVKRVAIVKIIAKIKPSKKNTK